MPLREVPPKTVAIVLPAEIGFAREIRRGISDWIRQAEGWSFLPGNLGMLRYFEGKGEKFAGCIGFFGDATLRKSAQKTTRQVVNISNNAPPDPTVCSILNDDREIGRIAARYFIRRGYTRLHFLGLEDSEYARERRAGIDEVAAAAGVSVTSAKPWRERDGFIKQLRAIPHPSAVICANDNLANILLREARILGIPVPANLAVLGIDDNDFFVEAEPVSLGSVRPNARAIGWKAMEAISGGKARAGVCMRVKPEGIIERKSCTAFAVEDERIRRVLHLMDEGYRKPVDFGKLAAAAGLGRRNFFLLFGNLLQTTPAQWLEELRVGEARRLLTGTALPLEEVSERCGFDNTVTFWRTFRRHSGQAPGAFRAASLLL